MSSLAESVFHGYHSGTCMKQHPLWSLSELGSRYIRVAFGSSRIANCAYQSSPTESNNCRHGVHCLKQGLTYSMFGNVSKELLFKGLESFAVLENTDFLS